MMRLLPAVRRSAFGIALLLVPVLAVLSFDRWPSQPALADSTALPDDATAVSSSATTTAVQNDDPITLQNWEDTDRDRKVNRSPKGKGKGPPDGVPPGPPDGVPPGPPKGIK